MVHEVHRFLPTLVLEQDDAILAVLLEIEIDLCADPFGGSVPWELQVWRDFDDSRSLPRRALAVGHPLELPALFGYSSCRPQPDCCLVASRGLVHVESAPTPRECAHRLTPVARSRILRRC